MQSHIKLHQVLFLCVYTRMLQHLSYLLTRVLYDSRNNGRAEGKTIKRGMMCLASSLGGIVLLRMNLKLNKCWNPLTGIHTF